MIGKTRCDSMLTGNQFVTTELNRQENVTPDEGLAVWRAWIDEVDFESWWYREL